jgi:hypothetical protein
MMAKSISPSNARTGGAIADGTYDGLVAEAVSDRSRRPSLVDQFLGNRTVLVILLYGATLFLGLPALWVSPVFTKTEKTIHSLLVCVWSAVVLTGFVLVMTWAMAEIRASLG